MFMFRKLIYSKCALVALCSALAMDVLSSAPDIRDTRLFRIDKTGKVVGAASHVPPALALHLVSVTPDQPQFWPDEKLRVRVIMPGRGGQPLVVKWFKRDATATEVPEIALDAQGLAVIELADGKSARHQLGEYRVEVKTADGKATGHTTFAVVEGTLGAVSLAYAFDRVTSTDQLERVKGGWYLGSAGGAGSRWGNGLSFKNELRIDNVPYDGDVELIPRCMLSGCNGVVAGPEQKVRVEKGALAATLAIGGHSGPFQVEIITPSGSLRHQFEGSGHVEREMIVISKGVRHTHRVGLAPYDKTQQVPGRQLFVDRHGPVGANDAFEVESPIATDGKLTIKARIDLKKVAVVVWQAQAHGGFAPLPMVVADHLQAGESTTVAVPQPMALVAVGGVANNGNADDFREGYVLAFAPAGLKASLAAPKELAPNGSATVEVQLRDSTGKPLAGSGILEAYDIRVAARDPSGQLASAVGDSVRTAGRHLEAWVDPIELERQHKEEERQRKEQERLQKQEERREREQERKGELAHKKSLRTSAAEDSRGSYGAIGSGGGGASDGMGAGSIALKASAPKAMRVGVGHAHGGRGGSDDDEIGEIVREGEVKIAFVGIVRTDADGKARVEVTLPPQTGRLAWRFTAVVGLDWATAQAQSDLVRQAAVEIKAPRALVAGGTLDLQVVTQSKLSKPLTLVVSGAGFERPVTRNVASGKQTHLLAWPAQAGEIVAALVDDAGKTHDKRVVKIADIAKQKITFSRLQVGGNQSIAVQPGERAIAYAHPGALMHGIVSNVVTTMESWFPHAEALSAQVAVRATLLAAISRDMVPDDGYRRTLVGGLEQAILKLQRELYDPPSRMIRPYAGIAPHPRWSGWVAANLQIARRTMQLVPQLRTMMGVPAATALDQLAKDLSDGMVARAEKTESYGFSAARDGAETVEIDVEGGGRFEVITDDIVQQFVIDKLGPALETCGDNCADDTKALGKALDHFRLVRAFARVGRLQWLIGQAKVAWAAGPRGEAVFDRLFGIVARGLVLSQEPGMVQGPALLGGVYSQPMALPRFLELLLTMALKPAPTGAIAAASGDKPRKLSYGQVLEASSPVTLKLPRGAIARIDRLGSVDLRTTVERPFAKALVAKADLAIGEQSELVLELDSSKDPLEFYALIAVPTTVAIRQTEDALSDYKGQLIYGQQSMGSAKMQVIAVPFRGLRTLRIWIEGLLPGQAPGFVAVRHVHDPDQGCAVAIPSIKVRAAPVAGAGAAMRAVGNH